MENLCLVVLLILSEVLSANTHIKIIIVWKVATSR